MNKITIYTKYFLLIHKKGGTLLDKGFINYNIPLTIKCKNNHITKQTIKNINRNKYLCIECTQHKKGTIEEMKELAINNNGECMSNKYINDSTKLQWKCKNNHIFNSTPSNIKSGRWCKQCANNKKRLDITVLQNYAKSKEGKLLSTEYKNTNQQLLWECNNGHTWYAKYSNISQGKWCPHCNYYISENLCKYIFEEMFETTFKKCRPRWLINPKTNKTLELDGYNENLKLAFEYDGAYHYQSIKKSNLDKIQQKDKIKDKLCKEKNINLIRIPYTIKKENFQKYIINECEKSNIIITNKTFINISKINLYCNKLKEIQQFAIENDLKLLSTNYLSNISDLEWKCNYNHIIKTSYCSMKLRNNKCRQCIIDNYLSYEKLQDINLFCKKNNIELVSKYFLNKNKHLKWKCSNEHIFEASWRCMTRRKKICLLC